MIALGALFAGLVLTALAEWLHARRCRRVARLAFGPGGAPRAWVAAAPWLRTAAVGALAWGLTTLLLLGPRALRADDKTPEGGYRHLILALDVSPSMQLADAGPNGKQTRATRASDVLTSLLGRIVTEQVRISIVAFYTGAKPVVVDTFDLEVVNNCLNDLPLDLAFQPGKTELLDGVRASADLAKAWQPESTILVVVSDGDTIPDNATPELPRAIQRTLIVGVGDARSGRFIDGHQSRQDFSTLRQLAARLHGDYFDANEKHLPSKALTALSRALPLRDARDSGRRELALASVGTGAFLLAALPVALALGGTSWQAGRESKRSIAWATRGRGWVRAVFSPKKTKSETMTYA